MNFDPKDPNSEEATTGTQEEATGGAETGTQPAGETEQGGAGTLAE